MPSDEPASGQAGTRVTIFGSNLLGQVGTEITSVKLAGVPAEIVDGTSQTQVVVIAAEGTAGSGSIVLEANTGATAVQPQAWQYINPGRIDSVQPTSGQLGTLVTIKGYELLGGGQSPANVTLANAQAQVVSFNSTHMVVRAPSAEPPRCCSWPADHREGVSRALSNLPSNSPGRSHLRQPGNRRGA